MNPYSPVDIPLKPGNDGWIVPVFIAIVIFISIWWNG